MPDENEQKKERSRISVRIGEVQVELEGTYDNIKKLMGKELFDFAEGLKETTKQLPSSTKITSEVTPKEKTMPPPIRPSTPSETLLKPSQESTIGKTTEKASRRKIEGRKAAIALVLVSIVLLAGLVSVIALYVPRVGSLESQITEKDAQITEKDSELSLLNMTIKALQNTLSQIANDIANKDSQIAALNLTISSYISTLSDYRSILLLQKSGLLYSQNVTQDANTYTVLWSDQLDYAGVVTVAVQSSSNTTYVETVYSSFGVNFDHNMTVGTSGTAAFPVLPGLVEVRVGNTEIAGGVTAAITATYYY
jgi:hypothetical protein